jgi:hypothetical protein
MKTLKMSLENIQGKMSRLEMRNIMAGSTSNCNNYCDGTYPPCSGECAKCSPIPNWTGKSVCIHA